VLRLRLKHELGEEEDDRHAEDAEGEAQERGGELRRIVQREERKIFGVESATRGQAQEDGHQQHGHGGDQRKAEFADGVGGTVGKNSAQHQGDLDKGRQQDQVAGDAQPADLGIHVLTDQVDDKHGQQQEQRTAKREQSPELHPLPRVRFTP
jgi:hypothetical protein